METLTPIEFVCEHFGSNNLPVDYMFWLYVCGIIMKSALMIPSRKLGDSVTTIKPPDYLKNRLHSDGIWKQVI